MEAFTAEPDLDTNGINFAVYKGLAGLTGTVASDEDCRRAAEIAGAVPGVGTVQNNLVVQQE